MHVQIFLSTSSCESVFVQTMALMRNELSMLVVTGMLIVPFHVDMHDLHLYTCVQHHE